MRQYNLEFFRKHESGFVTLPPPPPPYLMVAQSEEHRFNGKPWSIIQEHASHLLSDKYNISWGEVTLANVEGKAQVVAAYYDSSD